MKRRARRTLADRLRGVKVSEQLAAQIRGASPEEFGQILDMLDHYVQAMQRANREQRPSPGGRAAGVHDAMTQPLANVRLPAGRTVQCRSGCASCCRVLVTVFPDEATLALMAAADVGIEVDRERLARQAAAGHSVEKWRELSRADRTCVFLRDERCTVYEHRPGACRKYAVASSPEFCDVDRHPGHDVEVVAAVEAEVISSAAMTVYGQAPFAVALLAALKN